MFPPKMPALPPQLASKKASGCGQLLVLPLLCTALPPPLPQARLLADGQHGTGWEHEDNLGLVALHLRHVSSSCRRLPARPPAALGRSLSACSCLCLQLPNPSNHPVPARNWQEGLQRRLLTALPPLPLPACLHACRCGGGDVGVEKPDGPTPQNITACPDPPGFDRTKFGLLPGQGRGAPEIDLIEVK